MSEVATEVLPVPVPTDRRARRRRSRWQLSIAAGVAGSVGFAGAAIWSDRAADEGEQAAFAGSTAQPLPVLAPEPAAAQLSRAASVYGISEWSSDTRSLVLGAWGAVFSDLISQDAGGAGLPTMAIEGGLVDDPRLGDPAAPAFVDPCASVDATAEACPTGRTRIGAVLGTGRLPPNAAVVHAFPNADVRVGAECDFEDPTSGTIPVAVMTANPGTVTVTVGDERATVRSDESERAEWEAWIDHPMGTRPPVTFVAHCIAVARPDGPGPFRVRAVATDDEDQVAVAETAIAPLIDGLPPVSLTALDDSMLRVEVPLPAGTEPAVVAAAPLASLLGVADCNLLPSGAPAGIADGWRRGAWSIAEPPAGGRARPWLAGAPRVQRVTMALPEGEPSLVCVTYGSGEALRRTGLLVTPPDARRLVLAVSSLDLTSAAPGGVVTVRGVFAELGWMPCGARVPAPGAGVTEPGLAGILCISGGDTGAIADAGGVVDLTVETGALAAHRTRISLSTRPGGTAVESYRVPVPAPTLEGMLCTVGVDQPGCVEPAGDAVIGTLVVTATWNEGPIGPPDWVVAPIPVV